MPQGQPWHLQPELVLLPVPELTPDRQSLKLQLQLAPELAPELELELELALELVRLVMHPLCELRAAVQ